MNTFILFNSDFAVWEMGDFFFLIYIGLVNKIRILILLNDVNIVKFDGHRMCDVSFYSGSNRFFSAFHWMKAKHVEMKRTNKMYVPFELMQVLIVTGKKWD